MRLKIDNHARRQQRIMTGLLAAALLVTAACTSSGNSAATSTTMTGTSTAKAPASGSTGSGTTSPGTGSSVTSSAGAEPAYAAKVTAGVEKAMKDNVIPGAVVLISSPDQGDWTGTFGTGTSAAAGPDVGGRPLPDRQQHQDDDLDRDPAAGPGGQARPGRPDRQVHPERPGRRHRSPSPICRRCAAVSTATPSTPASTTRWTVSAEGLDATGTARHRLLAPGQLRHRAASSTTATPTSSCWAW